MSLASGPEQPCIMRLHTHAHTNTHKKREAFHRSLSSDLPVSGLVHLATHWRNSGGQGTSQNVSSSPHARVHLSACKGGAPHLFTSRDADSNFEEYVCNLTLDSWPGYRRLCNAVGCSAQPAGSETLPLPLSTTSLSCCVTLHGSATA